MTSVQPQTVVLTIRAPLERGDLPGLVKRSCELLAGEGIEELRCEVGGVQADGVAIDALARLALAARRRGCRARLAGASEQLVRLIRLTGLEDVLGE